MKRNFGIKISEIKNILPHLNFVFSWENHYSNELVNFDENGDEGEVWFGRSAENRMLRFVSDKVPKNAKILDVGTGNGSVLRKLRQKGFYNLTGIDYCGEAVELAKKLAKAEEAEASPKIEFKVADLIAEKTDPLLCRRFQVKLYPTSMKRDCISYFWKALEL